MTLNWIQKSRGEVADMELAIVFGRGPDGGLKPLVRDEDIVIFGCRDEELWKSERT
jgi:hypothetical protein